MANSASTSSNNPLQKTRLKRADDTARSIRPSGGKRISSRFLVDTVLLDTFHACDYLLGLRYGDGACVRLCLHQLGRQGMATYGCVRISHVTLCHLVGQDSHCAVDVYHEERDELVEVTPRTILRRQIERAAERGYVAMGGGAGILPA